jgi:putative transposase
MGYWFLGPRSIFPPDTKFTSFFFGSYLQNAVLSIGMLLERPQPSENALQHLCLDKGYDYEQIDELVDSLGYISHIKRCGQDGIPGIGEPVYPARRWKVERTISWLNNMRKLRTRWEKKARNYRALWLLAASLIVYRLIVLG